MLYVSRFVSRFSYGIVDTDDGKEEVVASHDVTRAVQNLGLTIMGVETTEDSIVPNLMVVNEINPWQAPSTCTTAQTKMLMLNGIEVVAYKGAVSHIRYETLHHSASLRVADFGNCLLDRFMYGNKAQPGKKLTIVLDDSISFSKHSFMQWGSGAGGSCWKDYGIYFDLRAVNDEAKLHQIYYEITLGLNAASNLDIIIDSNARKEAMVEKLLVRWSS